MSFFACVRPRRAAPLFRRALAISASWLLLPFAWAQSPTTTAPATAPLTLSDAFRIAIAFQPWQIAQDERKREQVARERVADSWLADTPTIASGLRTGNRDGLREFEIEISAPIATASRRNLQLSAVRGESAVYLATLAQQRLKLAGEIREAYWAIQLASAELALVTDEVARAAQLAADSARRTAAGDSARVDTLQAQTAHQAARSNLVEAELKFDASKQTLRSLIGDAALRALASDSEQRAETSARRANWEDHASLQLVRATSASARAKLNEASGVPNSAPALSFTLTNERTNNGASATSARVGISIPFGGAQRAAPKIAQANAELIEAQASEPLVVQHLRADFDSAQRALSSIEARIDILSERARLATEVAELYAKAYRLGELDLPTRLRAEGERAAAALALVRARIEQKHAISRVNQSLGILP